MIDVDGHKVANPLDCENKQCKAWKTWFLSRWALIHAYPRKAMDKDDLKPAGVSVGGRTYAPPERVREYLDTTAALRSEGNWETLTVK